MRSLFPLLLAACFAGCFCAPAIADDAPATTLPAQMLWRLDEKSIRDRTANLAQYEKQLEVTGAIRTSGGGDASMLVTRWANEFRIIHPKATFDIVGGGAEVGLAAMLADQSDIFPLVRTLNNGEINRLRAKFGHPPTQVVVALDAMAVYVNPLNSIPQLTTEQLEAIFSRAGKHGVPMPERWGQLGVTGRLADRTISRYSLNDAHSSYTMFRTIVLGGEDFRFDTRFERVTGGLIDSVAADQAAIGFATVMVASEGTRFVPIVGADGKPYLPNYENTFSGAYPFTRKIVLVINKPPGRSLPAPLLEFLRFALSRRGQRIAGLWGSYPLNLEQQTQALKLIEP